eukprot:jgi/Ulvmu1/58/UM001_0061.1
MLRQTLTSSESQGRVASSAGAPSERPFARSGGFASTAPPLHGASSGPSLDPGAGAASPRSSLDKFAAESRALQPGACTVMASTMAQCSVVARRGDARGCPEDCGSDTGDSEWMG